MDVRRLLYELLVYLCEVLLVKEDFVHICNHTLNLHRLSIDLLLVVSKITTNNIPEPVQCV